MSYSEDLGPFAERIWDELSEGSCSSILRRSRMGFQSIWYELFGGSWSSSRKNLNWVCRSLNQNGTCLVRATDKFTKWLIQWIKLSKMIKKLFEKVSNWQFISISNHLKTISISITCVNWFSSAYEDFHVHKLLW